MSGLFAWKSDARRHEFKGDISKWNMSKVIEKDGMFGSEYDF